MRTLTTWARVHPFGGGMLYAWCELRQDDRMFNPSRILSIAPAD